MAEAPGDLGRNVPAEETALRLLARLKDELVFKEQTKDRGEAELPTKVLAERAVNTRNAHKWVYIQLQVLKFLLDFLDSDFLVQDASKSAVQEEMAEAKQQWKVLKAEYQQHVEAIKGAIPQALAKQVEALEKAQLLEEALQCYQAKKQEVEEKVRKAQDRIQKEKELLCEQQDQVQGLITELQNRLLMQHKEMQRLQEELQEQTRLTNCWNDKLQEISVFQYLLGMLQGVKLINASESDLELELISNSQPMTPNSHSLKLRLHWGDDGRVTLQSDNLHFLIPAVLPIGSCVTIKNIILDLQHSYSEQAQLLAEIESLQHCFAIDWQQENRLLHYLKPSSTCSLYVEPGYPENGVIRLLSVKSQHGTVDVTAYKPPQEMPSMKDWLEYLSTVDFSAPFLS